MFPITTRTTNPHRRPSRRAGRRLMPLLGLALVLALTGVGTDASAGDEPHGFEVVDRQTLAPGLEHLRMEGEDTVANVAALSRDAAVDLRTVVSDDRVGAGLERPSSMCARIDCLVAVNADFTLPGTHQPVGGVIRDGVPLRSPSPHHHQLLVDRDGSLAAGGVTFTATLVPTDLEALDVDGVNTHREEGDLVLYTPAFGDRTATNTFGTELVARTVRPAGPLALGATAVVELVAIDSDGDASIPVDGAVLSGHGAAAQRLAALWAGVQAGDVGARALLRMEAEPAAFQSVGGTPIILRDGRDWSPDTRADFVQGRHPRTLVGWNDDGERFLVTVDGRQPGHSAGVSLREAAAFMRSLGATDALNLDGGGSTTFVVRGQVVNRPSDRLVDRNGERRLVPVPEPGDEVLGSVERPRTTALAVVPAGAVTDVPVDPLRGDVLQLPEIELPPPTAVDPASDPSGRLPALVATTSAPRLAPPLVAVASAAVAAGLATWSSLFLARRRLRLPSGDPRSDHPAPSR